MIQHALSACNGTAPSTCPLGGTGMSPVAYLLPFDWSLPEPKLFLSFCCFRCMCNTELGLNRCSVTQLKGVTQRMNQWVKKKPSIRSREQIRGGGTGHGVLGVGGNGSTGSCKEAPERTTGQRLALHSFIGTHPHSTSPHRSVCAAITKYCRWTSFNNRHLFSRNSGG